MLKKSNLETFESDINKLKHDLSKLNKSDIE